MTHFGWAQVVICSVWVVAMLLGIAYEYGRRHHR